VRMLQCASLSEEDFLETVTYMLDEEGHDLDHRAGQSSKYATATYAAPPGPLEPIQSMDSDALLGLLSNRSSLDLLVPPSPGHAAHGTVPTVGEGVEYAPDADDDGIDDAACVPEMPQAAALPAMRPSDLAAICAAPSSQSPTGPLSPSFTARPFYLPSWHFELLVTETT